jgi:tetratricopeptide (TPR) repeat protein
MREAEAMLREYKALATRLIASDPSNPKWQLEGIYADTNLGIMLNESGRYSEASAVFENSLAAREKLSASAPDNVEYRKALISVLAWLGEAREKEGRLDAGLAQREREIGLLEPFLGDPKGDTQYRRDALVAYRAAGRLNGVRGDTAKGVEQLRKSVSIGEQLIQSEPQNTDWVSMTVYAKLELARFELARQNIDAASTLTRSACDMADRLVAKDASVIDWRLDLRGWCLELKTRTAMAQGANVEAREWADQRVALAQQEVSSSASGDAQLELASAEVMRGLAARSAGSSADARQAFEKAARLWPKQIPDRPSLIARKVLILNGLGRRDAANALAERLDRIGYRDPTYMRDRVLVGS